MKILLRDIIWLKVYMLKFVEQQNEIKQMVN